MDRPAGAEDGHPNEIARKDVKGVIEAVAEIGHRDSRRPAPS